MFNQATIYVGDDPVPTVLPLQYFNFIPGRLLVLVPAQEFIEQGAKPRIQFPFVTLFHLRPDEAVFEAAGSLRGTDLVRCTVALSEV